MPRKLLLFIIREFRSKHRGHYDEERATDSSSVEGAPPDNSKCGEDGGVPFLLCQMNVTCSPSIRPQPLEGGK